MPSENLTTRERTAEVSSPVTTLHCLSRHGDFKRVQSTGEPAALVYKSIFGAWISFPSVICLKTIPFDQMSPRLSGKRLPSDMAQLHPRTASQEDNQLQSSFTHNSKRRLLLLEMRLAATKYLKKVMKMIEPLASMPPCLNAPQFNKSWILFVYLLFWAAPKLYGGSQARG